MPHIAIISGGASTEREISLRSAKHVASLLQMKYAVQVYDFPRDVEPFLRDRSHIQLTIPLIHGRGGEDGSLQGFLEQLGIPYVFSGVTAHAIAMDKAFAKTIVHNQGVPVQESIVIQPGQSYSYSGPVAVKQIDGGSSIGVTRVDSQAALDATMLAAFSTAERVLIESWIDGPEFTVGVIDDQRGTRALPVTMIRPKVGSFFDYQQKYERAALAEELCPAPIHEVLAQRLQAIAVTAHQAIGARHVSRSDFIVDHDETPWFLEINTIPGMTDTSLLPKMLAASNSSLTEQFERWVHSIINDDRNTRSPS